MSKEKITRATVTPDGKVLMEQPDGSYRATSSKTDWERVGALADQEIEAAANADPDASLLDDDFWKNAKVVLPQRAPKRHQGMRLDVEVLDWFKAQGPGWQTRMNAVLKSYVESQKRGRHTP